MGAWFVIAFGVVVLLGALSSYRTVLRVRRWPTVPGRVIFRDVRHTTRSSDSEYDQWDAIVLYEYWVGGVRFECSRVGFQAHGYGTRDHATEGLATIPDEVTVHYDPAAPSEATLQLGGIAVPCFAAAMGLGILAVGIALLVSP